MPRKRQPKEIWAETRLRILERDEYRCKRCGLELTVGTAHIDHIRSGKLAGNEDSNLRSLCRKCHVLRSDYRHRGMISRAIEEGIIPPDWRPLVWDG